LEYFQDDVDHQVDTIENVMTDGLSSITNDEVYLKFLLTDDEKYSRKNNNQMMEYIRIFF